MSTKPEYHDPNASPANEQPKRELVKVRRGIDIRVFIWGGAAIGLLWAFISTVAAPPVEGYSPLQSFGFFAVFLTALCAVLVTGLGLIINYFIGKTGTKEVVVERVPEPEAEPDAVAEDDGADAVRESVEPDAANGETNTPPAAR